MSYDLKDEGYISTQLDYSKKSYAHSTLRHTRLLPLSGSTSVTVTPAGIQQTLIEIPTKCINLAQSFLCFNIDPAVAAASVALPVDMISYIQQIRLYTRSGVYLCDLNFVKQHSAVVRPLKTKIEEYLTSDVTELLAPQSKAAWSYETKYGVGAAGTPVSIAAPLAGGFTAGTFTAPSTSRWSGNSTSDMMLEPAHALIGSAAAAHDPTIQVQLPLSAFKNTILAYDKLLWFPEVIVLEINWAPGANAAAQATVPTAALADPSAGSAALATNMTYTGIALYCAVEQDTMVQTQLIEKVNSGTFSCLIPYTYVYKQNTAGTGSLSIKYNRGMGIVLQEIIWTVWNSTDNTWQAFDCSNGSNQSANANDAVKVTGYYTMVDGNRMEDQNINSAVMAAGAATSAVNEDYLLNKKFMRGSVYSNLDFYRYRFFHMNSFSSDYIEDVVPPGLKDNLVRGLPLTLERKYDMQAGSGGAAGPFNFYVFAKTQKLLSIGTMGITVA